MINYEIENKLLPYLILWTGQPKKGIIFRSSDAFVIPFSLLWAGFAIFWESSVVSIDAPFFFKLWGIPFVIMGLYITIGRFLADAQKRANTIYGITSDRIIIKSGIFSQDIKSINIKTLSDITFSQKSDNSGTITLGPTNTRESMMQGMDFPAGNQTPRLEFIENVKDVYDKIIKHQNN